VPTKTAFCLKNIYINLMSACASSNDTRREKSNFMLCNGLLNLRSTQHVSGTIMPIFRSSRLYRWLQHVARNTVKVEKLILVGEGIVRIIDNIILTMPSPIPVSPPLQCFVPHAATIYIVSSP
jgi:hypothetical protein